MALALGTWFGAGLMPIAPGTFGSLAAVPLILVLDYGGAWYRVIALAILFAVGIWASGRCQDLLGENDPPRVVIDEVAGLLLTTFLLPPSWLARILGFTVFRLFDILKPYPIGKVERLKGGVGIVMDDLLAGLYAYAGVMVVLFFL
ncbi:MAG: phosphatidylglycerophosphatase A [Thermodesulfobacteriota bacterium]|nr:phosphatidylglycerophosphatase A [Thermodesulfobacteriota bacterium]